MRNFLLKGLTCFLSLAIFGSTVSFTSHSVYAGTRVEQDQRTNEVKVKRGPEVGARVKKLKERNKAVRRALGTFEQKNHAPSIDESWAISGKLPHSQTATLKNCTTCGMFRKASFRAQDIVSGEGAEVIMVPTVSTDSEWQGTIIATSYDEAGNFLEQYVADIALIKRYDDIQPWFDVYEVSFDGTNAWIESDPSLGMVTDPGFEFGRSVYEQPDLQGGQISRLRSPKITPVNFQIRSDRNFYPPPTPPGNRVPDPRWGAYLGTVALGAAASGARCWIAGPFTLPCVGGGTAAVAIMALPLLFRSRPR
jgi:hypothetical protein